MTQLISQLVTRMVGLVGTPAAIIGFGLLLGCTYVVRVWSVERHLKPTTTRD